jgi:hypothetical protein
MMCGEQGVVKGTYLQAKGLEWSLFEAEGYGYIALLAGYSASSSKFGVQVLVTQTWTTNLLVEPYITKARPMDPAIC